MLWLSAAVVVCCSTTLCAVLCCPCTRVLLWCALHCAAPLCASANFMCLGVALSCAALVSVVRLCSGPGMPHYTVCCAASTRNGGHGYTGHGHTLLRGPSPGNLQRLGCRHTPVGGAGSKHPGLTNENCTEISSVRLCRLCVPGCCAVLYCSGVCCAALFRCVPLSALACRNALCAMLCVVLHQQRMVATATRATATLFYGGQVPATSEALRCRHTPVGGAGSKHPGPTTENCAHFSSHLISSHGFASVGSMGLGVAPPCAAVMCVALRCAMRLSVTPLCDALYYCARCVSRCAMCCVVSLCAVAVLYATPPPFVVLHCCGAGRPAWPHCASRF